MERNENNSRSFILWFCNVTGFVKRRVENFVWALHEQRDQWSIENLKERVWKTFFLKRNMFTVLIANTTESEIGFKYK